MIVQIPCKTSSFNLRTLRKKNERTLLLNCPACLTVMLTLLWKDGETTWEFLVVLAEDNYMTCVIYARERGRLNESGWKQFRRLAKNAKTLYRMANQAKLRSYRAQPVYKFGMLVPRNHAEAQRYDVKNGNHMLHQLSASIYVFQEIEVSCFLLVGWPVKCVPRATQLQSL